MKNQPISVDCRSSTSRIQKSLNLTSPEVTLRQIPGDKPMWLGAVLQANYNKGGLFETPPEKWTFTEPEVCSGLAEFYSINGRYEVRVATSRDCALIAKLSTPNQTLNVSGESALELGFSGYLSIKTKNPRFEKLRAVSSESFGIVSNPVRTVLNDAGSDSYPYISLGSQLDNTKETELLRLACHKGTFEYRDEVAANPTPDACLPAYWMQTSRNVVAAEDAIKYKAELDTLVAATGQLRQMRLKASGSKFLPSVVASLDALVDNFEQFERAQEELDKWAGPLDGILDCDKDTPCPKDSRKNAFNIYMKHVLPDALIDLVLLRDDPNNQFAQVGLNAKINVLVTARNAVFAKILEGLKAVSPILKDQSQNISILAHHQTTSKPVTNAILFKTVPLFPKTPTSYPELVGVLPSFDAGRLFVKFDAAGTNLQNALHEGSAVMLGNYPVTFLRVTQKQSGGASLINLPTRKSSPSEDETGTADTSGTKSTVGAPRPRSTSCAF